MKAIAVFPGRAGSMHLAEVPEPRLDAIPDGRGVLVKALRVGVDGTDKEINAAEYGEAPPGEPFLITGHESLGQVVEVGPNLPSSLQPGTVDDLVRAEAVCPGWLGRLLTTPVDGLENYEEMLRALTEDRNAIKVFVEVAEPEPVTQEFDTTTGAVT